MLTKTTGLVGLMVIAFLCLGLLLGKAMAKEETITEYITLPPEVITVTVEKVIPAPASEPIIIREIVPAEVIEIPISVREYLRDFASKAELKEFLDNDDTNTHIVLTASENGTVSLSGFCEDIAIQLQDRAEVAGYKMSFQSVGTMKLNSNKQWILTGRGHAICSVIIGNECIFIEPGTDEYWVGSYLD